MLSFVSCLLIFHGLSGRISETSCARVVTDLSHAFVKDKFHYLNVNKIGTFLVTDVFDCTFNCLRLPSCVSVNLASNTGADGTIWCELLSSDKYQNSQKFEGNQTSHHLLRKSQCISTPCQNGGTCLANYQDDTFTCLCKNDYIGQHCEKGATSCKELFEAYNFNTTRLAKLRFGSTSVSVYCHMGNFGCGDGVWTTVMKIDGNKATFKYYSSYWSDKNQYNTAGGETGFDSEETKLHTYWDTSFNKICLGMKVGGQMRFVALNKQATSLHSLIADGHYRATSLGRSTWKALIGSEASLQTNCNKEGFNAGGCYGDGCALVRIGIVSNEQNDCDSCDSRIGFGGAGSPDDSITCGNGAGSYPDNGDKLIKTMGYILVQ